MHLASGDEQIELMRRWFLARYFAPDAETAWSAGMGESVWGGDPRTLLRERFGAVADDAAIGALAADLYLKAGARWEPIVEPQEDFAQIFAFDFDRPVDPLWKLAARLRESLSIFELRGEPAAMAQLPKLVFGAAISALEAYLWETMVYWVKRDRDVLKGIVTRMPDFKDQPMKLGDIFEEHNAIEARTLAYLQNLVWHRWDKVAQLFRFGLGVKLPGVGVFEQALSKRHDIVHRSGCGRDGNPVAVFEQDARDLAEAVETFATEVFDLIAARKLGAQSTEPKA
ncbi:hypothetical protein [Massilia sp. Bi118]|uniref:hypothetical protein n=1 Tax=Massilia sp. Bi118 TaxID=2822346 RepID=UPI001E5ED8DD|nr:hypothetical protein [Massilia sp. Bi118]